MDQIVQVSVVRDVRVLMVLYLMVRITYLLLYSNIDAFAKQGLGLGYTSVPFLSGDLKYLTRNN